MDSAKITLGARTITVWALSLRQLRTVFPDFGKASATAPRPDGVDAAVQIVHAAALREQPDVSVDDISDGSIPEITAAMRTVLQLSGLVPTGEAVAVAPASPGETSTAA